MKNRFFILMLGTACACTLWSCTKNLENTGFAFGEVFELNFAAQKTSDDGALSVLFSKIDDSRCPLELDCFWEGQAEVTLKVAALGEESLDLKLILRAGYEALAIYTLGNYIYTLEEVLPYPVEPPTANDNDYVIKLKVVEL